MATPSQLLNTINTIYEDEGSKDSLDFVIWYDVYNNNTLIPLDLSVRISNNKLDFIVRAVNRLNNKILTPLQTQQVSDYIFSEYAIQIELSVWMYKHFKPNTHHI